MRIDYVRSPDLSGKTVPQALEILAQSNHDAAVQIMRLNNELEDLKSQIQALTQRLR